VRFDEFLEMNYLDKLNEINVKSSNDFVNKLIEENKKLIIAELIKNFGLQKYFSMFNNFKDGGNVTTVNNARNVQPVDNKIGDVGNITTINNVRNGVFHDKKIEERFNKKYNRKDYESNVYSTDANGNKVLEVAGLNVLRKNITDNVQINAGDRITVENPNKGITQKSKIRAKVSGNAERQMNNFHKKVIDCDGNIKDGYTKDQVGHVERKNNGKYVIKGRNEKDNGMHVEHIVSSSAIHKDDYFRLYFSDEERAQIALHEKNLLMTTGNANQSKGEKDAQEWAYAKRKNGQTNAEYFNKDVEVIKQKKEEAERFLKKMKIKGAAKYYTTEGVKGGIKQGTTQGLKQTLGIILFELINQFSIEIKKYIKDFKTYNTIKEKIMAFRKCCNRAKWNVIKNIKAFLGSFMDGFISGFIANVVTIIINVFQTTMKNVVKLINDAVQGIYSAIKILISKDASEDKYKNALKVFTSVMIGSFGGLLGISLQTYLSATPFALFADVISSTVTGILTGVTMACTLYMIDDYKEFINSLKGLFTANKVSIEEIKAKHESIKEIIEVEYQKVLNSILDEYETLIVKINAAYDSTIPYTERFQNSIVLAETLNVSKHKIIRDDDMIDDFFS